jgi:hypothetical protein
VAPRPRAHRFFATARWSADAVGLVLSDLIVDRLLPQGSWVTVVVDDTLFKRSGRKVFGVFCHHDGAAKGPKPIGFGNCWVVAGILVQLPFLTRPVCLPVLARLGHPRRTGKIAFARQMVEAIAGRHPDRVVHAVGNAAYVGEHLRGLDPRITWMSRLKVTSVLHHPPPPPTGRSGRARTRGARLATPGDLAATGVWRTTRMRRYGRTDTVQVTQVECLWYGRFHTRTVPVVLVGDDKPRTRDHDDRGYGLPLVTTDLTSTVEDLVARYASRWCVEVAFAQARQVLGVGQARNPTRAAVHRTVPFGLLATSLVILWYTAAAHAPDEVADRREHPRWYTTKTEPSFEDMTIKLRRVVITARFRPQPPTRHPPKKPGPVGARNPTTATSRSRLIAAAAGSAGTDGRARNGAACPRDRCGRWVLK